MVLAALCYAKRMTGKPKINYEINLAAIKNIALQVVIRRVKIKSSIWG